MSDSYEFIDHCAAEYAYPIIHMCHWLDVSRSGFYEWRDRPESATAARRAELTVLVTTIFDWSDQTANSGGQRNGEVIVDGAG